MSAALEELQARGVKGDGREKEGEDFIAKEK